MAKLPNYRSGGRGKHKKPEREDLKAQNLFGDEIQQNILDEVHDLFDGTYTVIRPGPWKRAFRPSGFPYCPVLDAMSGPENMEYSKAFYLDIGTTVHELMQEYISRSVYGRRNVYADWKCKDCGGMHSFSPLPYVCVHCGAEAERLHYEELAFENFRGIQGGHVDLFIRTKYGWIVADWKTASTTGLDYRNEADGKHHHQLQAYCLALQELFKDKLQGLPIIGYMLIFVPRDSSGLRRGTASNWTPYLYLWNRELAKTTRQRLFMQRASYEAATIGYETGNWRAAAMLRPCNSLSDFGKPMGMRDGFYGGELCPNLDICSRGCSDVSEAITKFRANLELDTKAHGEITTAVKNDYLSSAAQGFVSPTLLKVIADAEADDDFDFDTLQGLLATKESLERHIALTAARTRESVTTFFDGEASQKPNQPRAKPYKTRVKQKTKKS